MVYISVPCKKGSETNLVKPIETYLKGNMGSGQAAACKKGLDYIQKLRNEILAKLDDGHESTAKLIASYCDLLEDLEHRIPLTNTDIPIQYKWFDCFCGNSKVFRSSMKGFNASFDRCCMLFNLAAIHSQIAKGQNLDDDSGLKTAARSFQLSAGLFDYVKIMLPSCYSQSPTWDMSSEALDGYANLMVAQAQECIFTKAEKDSMKPSIIAKLALQASTLYTAALQVITLPSLKPYLPKDWSSIITANAANMEIYAEYYGALAAEAEQNFGEQIARLNKVLVLAKRISGTKDFVAKVEKMRDRAKKDNDLIYHELVPDVKALGSVGVAVVAKKLPVEFPLDGKPKDLFKPLVPIQVYNANQMAEGIKRQIVGAEVQKLREATETCNALMASLNLPAVVESSGGSDDVIPPSLLKKVAIIKDNGGVNGLRDKVSSLSDGNTRNAEMVADITSTLNEEEKTDDDLRKKYGDKWNRQESSKLNAQWRAELDKHRELLNQAGVTDKGLKDRFNSHEDSFIILSGSTSDLSEYIVGKKGNECSSPSADAGSSSKKRSLKNLCDQIENMKQERIDLMQQLEKTTLPESLTNEYLKVYTKTSAISNAQDLATEHINKALESARDCVKESLNKQTELLADIQKTYEAIFGKQKNDASILTTLIMATEAYEQLLQDVRQGITFYADLTGILVKFQNKVADYVFARQTEKQELMKDISKEITSESPGNLSQLPGKPSNPPPARPPPPTAPTTNANAPPARSPVPTNLNAPPNAFPMYGASQPMEFWSRFGMSFQGYPSQSMTQMPEYGMYGYQYPMPFFPMPQIPPQNPPPQ
nr:programmed cell death 6 interacting protein [Hymenolepis microstoma]